MLLPAACYYHTRLPTCLLCHLARYATYQGAYRFGVQPYHPAPSHRSHASLAPVAPILALVTTTTIAHAPLLPHFLPPSPSLM
jgi:hypothetical protein